MSETPQVTKPSAAHDPDFSQFRDLVREDLQANGGDWRYPGFQALFAYRVGRFRRNARTPVTRRLLRHLYPYLYRRARDRFGIEVHESSVIGRRVRLIHQSGIVLHPFTVVGDDCWIRNGVTMGARQDYHKDDHPTLGRGVRIGAGAVLIGTIRIGDGARIGPNAVVMEDVAAGATVLPPESDVVVRRRREAAGRGAADRQP